VRLSRLLIAQRTLLCKRCLRLQKQKQKQKLAAGNQPARSILAPGPAGTHGHIFVQCQDLCFVLFFLSLIFLIDKEELVFYIYIYIYIEWCLLTTQPA
jgi:hypothetical protein